MAPRHVAVFVMALTTEAPLDVARDVEFCLAHAVHAPCSYDLGISRLYLQGAVEYGFNSRTAAPVEHNARDRIWPAGIENCHPGAIGAFSVLVGGSHDYVIDGSGFDASPLDGLV